MTAISCSSGAPARTSDRAQGGGRHVLPSGVAGSSTKNSTGSRGGRSRPSPPAITRAADGGAATTRPLLRIALRRPSGRWNAETDAAPLNVVRLAGAHDVHAFGSAAKSFVAGRRDSATWTTKGPRRSRCGNRAGTRSLCRFVAVSPSGCRFGCRFGVRKGGAIGKRAEGICPVNTGDWAL